MELTTETALKEMALLKPRQSLQNVGEKKDEKERQNGGFQAFGPDGFTFLDFLDIVNPLQHIPIISTLYRDLTGDTIDPGSRIAGGTLFGGPIGAIVATANVALGESTGKDMGDHIMAFLNGDAGPGAETVKLADASPENAVNGNLTAFAPLSPIAANMEVLEWAQREAALMAGTLSPAPAQTADTKKLPDSRTVPATSIAASPAASYDIAANVEVRDWAQGEARLANSPGLLQARQGQQPSRDQESATVLDTAHQKAVASGRTQEQLSGAAAPSGGWFSETMLLALASYQDSAGLGKTLRAPTKAGATDQNMGE